MFVGKVAPSPRPLRKSYKRKEEKYHAPAGYSDRALRGGLPERQDTIVRGNSRDRRRIKRQQPGDQRKRGTEP